MVEPISLAVLSGVSLAGAVIGRFSKKEDSNFVTSSHQFQESKNIHFVNVEGNVNPMKLIKIAKEKPIFIKIKGMFGSPEDLEQFLYDLDITAKKHFLQLNQVSSDMLLLRDRSHKTIIQLLTSANRSKVTGPEININGG